jgi:hypothetical protein
LADVTTGDLWRYLAVVLLASVGFVWFLVAGLVQRTAIVNAIVISALLPVVMTPTRSWQQAFWRCIDIVYVATAVGALIAAHVLHVPWGHALAESIAPALLFGTMASLGVGRSGLGE